MFSTRENWEIGCGRGKWEMMDFMQLFGHHIPETRARGLSPIPRAHRVFFFAVPTSRIVSRFNLARGLSPIPRAQKAAFSQSLFRELSPDSIWRVLCPDSIWLESTKSPQTRARGLSPIPRAHKVFFFAVPTSRIVPGFNPARTVSRFNPVRSRGCS